MLGKNFCYDFSTEKWVPCLDNELATDLIEHLPVYFVIHRRKGPEAYLKNMVWCQEHCTYEEILSYENYLLTTKNGCTFRGLLGLEPPESSKSTALRWRVLYCEQSGIVNIFADKADIVMREGRDKGLDGLVMRPHLLQYRTDSIALLLSDKKIVPEDKLQQIPLPVVEAALHYLQDEAAKLYGKRPKLPASWSGPGFASGLSRLKAFINYPFDMNLWCLKVYFRNRQDFSKIFDNNESDKFPCICDTLGLEASPYLKEVYDKNPLAIPVISLLNYLGIKRRELVEPFLQLKELFGSSLYKGCSDSNLYLLHLGADYNNFARSCFEDESKMRTMINQRRINDIRFPTFLYCHWRLWKYGEDNLASNLLDMHKHWQNRYLNDFTLFASYYPDLPPDFKEHLGKEGFSRDVHNEMVRIINKKKLDWPEFTYSEKEMGYECEIDGFSFRLIYSNDTYQTVMEGIDTCRPGRNTVLPDNGTLRVAIYNDGRVVAYMELHGIIRLIMYRDAVQSRSSFRSASIHMACLHWLKWTGLWKNYGPYYEEDLIVLSEEVQAKPISKDVGLSLYELLHLPETKDGYYLRLHEAFLKSRPLCFETVPCEIDDAESEMAYLMELFPYGKRLYEAAFAGNSEAMYALSLCYYNGCEHNTLFPPDKESADFWSRSRYEKIKRKKVFK